MRVGQLHSEYLLPLVVSVHLWICEAWQTLFGTVHERRTFCSIAGSDSRNSASYQAVPYANVVPDGQQRLLSTATDVTLYIYIYLLLVACVFPVVVFILNQRRRRVAGIFPFQ